MSNTSLAQGVNALRNGELIIVFDDMKSQIASFVGIAESVSPQKVNAMIKLGKGLVSVCMTEDQANKLKLPFMVQNNNSLMKPFTISVDYISTTTGISAFERSDTIKAFTNKNVQMQQFRTPGHVFPLVSKTKGLLQRVDIVEAAVDLAIISSAFPVAYICEILNTSGNIATKEEIDSIAKTNDIFVINISDILDYIKNDILCSFTCPILKKKQPGQKIGFPTFNLQIDLNKVHLDKGVYGVNISINHVKYVGVMNVGIRCEVHLLDFSDKIYDQSVKVDVLFFVRDEISFSMLDELILQIGKDVEYVESRCGLQKVKN